MQTNQKKVKTKKMVLPTVELATPHKMFEDGNEMFHYHSDSWLMSIANRKRKGLIEQCFDFAGCREVFIANLRCQLSKHEDLADFRDSDTLPFSTGKTRLLLARISSKSNASSGRSKFLKQLKAGINLTNIFAKKYGWDPTQMYEAKSETFTKFGSAVSLVCVEADRKWLFSPYMMSLFVLLLRCGKQARFQNVTTLNGFLSKVDKKLVRNKDEYMSNDVKYIDRLGAALPTLFEHYGSIFKGRTIRTNYDDTHLKFDGEYGDDLTDVEEDGISTLVNGPRECCFDKKILGKLHILLDKEFGKNDE